MEIYRSYHSGSGPAKKRATEQLDDLTEKRIQDLKIPYTITAEEAWSKLSQKINITKDKHVRRINPVYRWISAAAAVIILLGITGLFFFNHVEYSCGKAERLIVYLPDSSKVTLNSDTQLSYTRFTWFTKRIVKLDGEAFFNVRKGKIFEVKTSSGTVHVLGTSFNVFSRKNSFKVYCETGKVKVISDKEVILTPGSAVVTNNNMQLKSPEPASTDLTASWKNGQFFFNNAPLEAVFNEMERQFNVKIEYHVKTERYYTGYFTNNDLKTALVLVCSPMQLHYKVSKNKIIIN